MYDFFGNTKKLYTIYDSKLEFSGITLLSVLLSILLFLIYLGVISGYLELLIILTIITHLFGFEIYARKKIRESVSTPEVIEWHCPNPKCKTLLFSTKLLCPKCGTDVNPKL